jgi:hypothetical protein
MLRQSTASFFSVSDYVTTPYSLVEGYQKFGESFYLSFQCRCVCFMPWVLKYCSFRFSVVEYFFAPYGLVGGYPHFKGTYCFIFSDQLNVIIYRDMVCGYEYFGGIWCLHLQCSSIYFDNFSFGW